MATARYKKTTPWLDETAVKRFWLKGSGGESMGESSSSSDSAQLADLVDSFYHEEEEIEKGRDKDDGEYSGWLTCRKTKPGDDIRRESLEAVLAESKTDPVARRIRVEAERAARVVGGRGDGEFKRRVIVWFREKGFDAGLCKSSWKREDGRPAGKHEYIDVIGQGGMRYIVEINFAAEFEIARPSGDYAELLRGLPSVFVGMPRVVESVVGLMCAAMKESIRSSGMHLPPWRRKLYVRAKWLGSYERNSSNDSLEMEKEGLDESCSMKKKKKQQQQLCRIELRCRDMKVRKGMLAVELGSLRKGYGF
ncbi:hypothetical protein Cni_G28262 [Canna indica]|uniref:DUF506 family protein n=1 Tax=Canna indica TaxID=4628 RepID=A0AAQ3L350_9LILI|nr:hypothetical protein Cni_G28262 [Canna indica]